MARIGSKFAADQPKLAERWRHEAKDGAKRANDLVAELCELTCEHVKMVALRAGQSAI